MAVRPHPDRLAQLQVIADAHDRWVKEYLADDTPFTSRSGKSDYNLHYLDVEATPAQEAELQVRVQLALTAHLPGKHDQSTHGKGGAGYGIDPEVAASVDRKRVVAWKKQPTAKIEKTLARDDLHPADRAELEVAFVEKTGGHKPPPPVREKADKVDDGESWGDDHYGAWEDSLTKPEVDAIKAYTSTQFCHRVNKSLRSGRKPTGDDATRMRTLDDAIARAPRMPKDTEVYRSMTIPGGGGDALRRGVIYQDNGFGSTSISRDVAIRNFGQGTLAVIRVPKGSRGAFISKSLNRKGFEEDEFLLPRGTKYRVTSSRNDDRLGKIVVHMEVIE